QSRDPGKWPFSAASPWNTPLGDGALFEGKTAPCTADVLAAAAGAGIASHEWSVPIYLALAGDPTNNLSVNTVIKWPGVRVPASATASLPPLGQGGEALFTVVEPVPRRYVYELSRAVVVAGGWDGNQGVRYDLYGTGILLDGFRNYGG